MDAVPVVQRLFKVLGPQWGVVVGLACGRRSQPAGLFRNVEKRWDPHTQLIGFVYVEQKVEDF